MTEFAAQASFAEYSRISETRQAVQLQNEKFFNVVKPTVQFIDSTCWQEHGQLVGGGGR
jgi:hypothetical protein